MAMSKVVLDTSISIDGFVAGENDARGNGLGDGGDPLHTWLMDDAPDRYRDEMFARTGAIVASRKVYDITRGWNGSHPVGHPVFVVTHAPPDAGEVPQGATPFTFVTSGVGDAIAAARTEAGGREVYLMSAAAVGRQALAAELVDELRIHVAPLVLGAGTRLFDAGGVGGPVALERIRVVESPHATHLEFRVRRASASGSARP
jgi:dihydrofolate reductase